MAKPKLRCLASPRNTHKGAEVRLGDCVPIYRVATERPSGRWVGFAGVGQVERDSIGVSYRGGVRRVPRNWVRSYTRACDPPAVATTRIPEATRRYLPANIPVGGTPMESTHDSPKVKGEDFLTETASSANPANHTALPVNEALFRDLLDPLGGALREKCQSLRYHKNASRRGVAEKIHEWLVGWFYPVSPAGSRHWLRSCRRLLLETAGAPFHLCCD